MEEFLKWWELSEADMEWIVEHKALIEKFINHAIRNIRCGMLSFQFKTKEEVMTQINTLINLREWLSGTLENYKQYVASKETVDEAKIMDTRSEEEKQAEEEVIRIKRKYKI